MLENSKADYEYEYRPAFAGLGTIKLLRSPRSLILLLKHEISLGIHLIHPVDVAHPVAFVIKGNGSG